MEDEYGKLDAEIDKRTDQDRLAIINKFPSTLKAKSVEQGRKNALSDLNRTMNQFRSDQILQIEDRIENDFQKIISDFNKKIDSAQIDTIINAQSGSFSRRTDISPELDSHLLPIYKALAWVLLAKKFLRKSEHVNRCWYCITEAQYYRGTLGNVLAQKKTKIKTSNSGKSTATKTNYTKEEVKKLLVELKPADGWGSDLEATKTINHHLKKTSSSQHAMSRLSLQATEKKLPTWLKNNAEISALFKLNQTTIKS